MMIIQDWFCKGLIVGCYFGVYIGIIMSYINIIRIDKCIIDFKIGRDVEQMYLERISMCERENVGSNEKLMSHEKKVDVDGWANGYG